MEHSQPSLKLTDRRLWERCPQERKHMTKSDDRFPDRFDFMKNYWKIWEEALATGIKLSK